MLANLLQNRTALILLAMAGSAGLLLGAWSFQYIGGMAPCELCIWQRWPHGAAFLFGLLALRSQGPVLPVLGGLGAATSGGIGVLHTGVERDWWEGLTSCTSGDITGMSTDDLMEQIMAAPIVRCDEVPWEMFTLSMASWNAVVSFGLAAVWFWAATRRA